MPPFFVQVLDAAASSCKGIHRPYAALSEPLDPSSSWPLCVSGLRVEVIQPYPAQSITNAQAHIRFIHVYRTGWPLLVSHSRSLHTCSPSSGELPVESRAFSPTAVPDSKNLWCLATYSFAEWIMMSHLPYTQYPIPQRKQQNRICMHAGQWWLQPQQCMDADNTLKEGHCVRKDALNWRPTQ